MVVILQRSSHFYTLVYVFLGNDTLTPLFNILPFNTPLWHRCASWQWERNILWYWVTGKSIGLLEGTQE